MAMSGAHSPNTPNKPSTHRSHLLAWKCHTQQPAPWQGVVRQNERCQHNVPHPSKTHSTTTRQITKEHLTSGQVTHNARPFSSPVPYMMYRYVAYHARPVPTAQWVKSTQQPRTLYVLYMHSIQYTATYIKLQQPHHLQPSSD